MEQHPESAICGVWCAFMIVAFLLGVTALTGMVYLAIYVFKRAVDYIKRK